MSNKRRLALNNGDRVKHTKTKAVGTYTGMKSFVIGEKRSNRWWIVWDGEVQLRSHTQDELERIK
jgi:hypothetical protein